MRDWLPLLVVFFLLVVIVLWFKDQYNQTTASHFSEKMRGVSFVAPPKAFLKNPFKPVKDLNADWVAVMPYAFSLPGSPRIHFDTEKQWWGERTEGTIQTIAYAQEMGVKVLLKPHIWVRGDGWTGDFVLQNDAEWREWEQEYLNYILPLAMIADSMKVEAFCIGLEFKRVIEERPECWKRFISEVRKVYSGMLTYAANWDNFKNVTFWDQLDFIGINAYFPLSTSLDPSKELLYEAWGDPLSEIRKIHKKYGKPIVFTEFGYRSLDKSTGNQWELEDNWNYTGDANLELQSRAYEVILDVFWDEPWFSGGYVWKWYDNHNGSGGPNNTDYTPQNKPAEEVLRQWYAR
jgi:hypothetical protein